MTDRREMPPDELARRFKRMAKQMAYLHPWPDSHTSIRARGDVECGKCGLPYSDHPASGGLHMDCVGRLLKL